MNKVLCHKNKSTRGHPPHNMRVFNIEGKFYVQTQAQPQLEILENINSP